MRTTVLPLALLAGAALAAPAQAEPTDLSCPAAKVLADDPAGDQRLYGAPTTGNLDITRVTIQPTAEGSGRVAFTIPTLDRTVPPYTTGLSWYFEYTVNGTARYVDASLTPDGTVTYGTGTDGQTYTPDGSTSGSYTTGAPGRIVIDVPDVTWGDQITTMRAVSYHQMGVSTPLGSAAFLPAGDTVPIAGAHTLQSCEVPAG